jgi:transposase
MRENAVNAYLEGKGTQEEIADMFGMGVRTLRRFLRRSEERGDLEPELSPGRPPILNESDQQRIQGWVEAKPDIELKELCDAVAQELGKVVSESTLCHVCQQLDLRRKKKSYCAAEQAREEVKKASRLFGNDRGVRP